MKETTVVAVNKRSLEHVVTNGGKSEKGECCKWIEGETICGGVDEVHRQTMLVRCCGARVSTQRN